MIYILLKEVKNSPIFVGELGIKAEPGFSSTRFVVLEDDLALSEKEVKDAVKKYRDEKKEDKKPSLQEDFSKIPM